jgi:NADH-quinone oxidoreductase subunit G
MCDEGRYGYHFTHSSQRIRQPSVRWPTGEASSDSENRRLLSWSALFPRLRQAWQSIGQRSDTRLLLVVSPFLTVEEAYLLTLAVRTLTPQVQLALGPVPIVGEDDRYPKDVHGRPIEPAKFVIRAEKCPNRRGVEAILRHFATEVVSFEQAITQYWDALWFAGGYPDVSMVDAALPPQGSVPTPTLLVVQDLFFSHLAQAAHFFLPATSSFEKEGTFINYAGVAQSFPRAIRPPMNIRSELQLAHELLGRPGLAQAASVRRELAQAIPELEHLTTLAEPVPRGRYALTTV